MFPENLKYTQSHEWVLVDGDEATIGITDHAVKLLSDLVFIDLPDEGTSVSAGEAFGEIESVKAVSDLNSPVSGTVTEVNNDLADTPETLGDDAYEKGWMIKVKINDISELDRLIDAQAYANLIDEE